MGEGLVGFGHFVGIVLLFDGLPTIVIGVQKLCRQLVGHGLTGAPLGVVDNPAYGQGITPFGPHFNRHLIGSATHTAALHLDLGPHVLDRKTHV